MSCQDTPNERSALAILTNRWFIQFRGHCSFSSWNFSSCNYRKVSIGLGRCARAPAATSRPVRELLALTVPCWSWRGEDFLAVLWAPMWKCAGVIVSLCVSYHRTAATRLLLSCITPSGGFFCSIIYWHWPVRHRPSICLPLIRVWTWWSFIPLLITMFVVYLSALFFSFIVFYPMW